MNVQNTFLNNTYIIYKRVCSLYVVQLIKRLFKNISLFMLVHLNEYLTKVFNLLLRRYGLKLNKRNESMYWQKKYGLKLMISLQYNEKKACVHDDLIMLSYALHIKSNLGVNILPLIQQSSHYPVQKLCQCVIDLMTKLRIVWFITL